MTLWLGNPISIASGSGNYQNTCRIIDLSSRQWVHYYLLSINSQLLLLKYSTRAALFVFCTSPQNGFVFVAVVQRWLISEVLGAVTSGSLRTRYLLCAVV
jgi:hypothetical protein